jgi:hypothetical protein
LFSRLFKFPRSYNVIKSNNIQNYLKYGSNSQLPLYILLPKYPLSLFWLSLSPETFKKLNHFENLPFDFSLKVFDDNFCNRTYNNSVVNNLSAAIKAQKAVPNLFNSLIICAGAAGTLICIVLIST